MLSAIPTLIAILLLRPPAIPGVRLTRRLDAQGIDRSAGGQKQGFQIGAAERDIGRHLGGADNAEPSAVRGEDPGAARSGAEDAAGRVDLHAVGNAVALVRRHVGENPPPHDSAGPVQLDRMDVLGEARIGDVEDALVRREGEPVRVFAFDDEALAAVRHHAIDRRRRQLALGDGHAQSGVGEPDAAVRFADDVVRPVEPFALPAVHQDFAVGVGRPAGDAAVAALADDEPTVEIEGRAVALAGIAAHGPGLLARGQPMQRAAADIDEIIKAVGVPQRPLGEFEAGRQALRFGSVQNLREIVHACPPAPKADRAGSLPPAAAAVQDVASTARIAEAARREERRAAMKWRIGRVTVSKIVELEATGGSRFLLPQATREAILPIAWLFPHFADAVGRLKMSIHALVVETPSCRILVDTCLGNDKENRRIPTWNRLQTSFLADLAAAGYPRETIDTVLCTHLHVDHVG